MFNVFFTRNQVVYSIPWFRLGIGNRFLQNAHHLIRPPPPYLCGLTPPPFCRWRTAENVVVDLICCRDVRVDVNFRDSIDDIGLTLDNFDVFRDTRDGISVQNPYNCCKYRGFGRGRISENMRNRNECALIYVIGFSGRTLKRSFGLLEYFA